MIPFVASLYNSRGASQVSIDANCQNFSINDLSNYYGNTEPGHASTDFSNYRVIIITHQSGQTYVLSSIASDNPNQVILPANSGINTFTVPIFAGDGVYTFQLFTVPTYNPAVNYVGNTENVFYGTSLYLATANSIGQTPSPTSSYWSVVTQAQLLSAYQDMAPAAVACSLKVCMDKAVQCAVCDMATCNNFELCNNPKFLLANKLTLLYYNIQAAMNAENLESAKKSFDLALTLCIKCPSC